MDGHVIKGIWVSNKLAVMNKYNSTILSSRKAFNWFRRKNKYSVGESGRMAHT